MRKRSFLVFAVVVACSVLAWQIASATWTDTTDLPTDIQMGGSAFYNDYVYYVSGWRTNPTAGGSQDVFYAPVGSDGTVGTWSTTSQLPVDHAYISNSVCVHNGYIYSPSGWSHINIQYENVYYAAINPDGTLGSWVDAGALPLYDGSTKGVDCHVARIYGGRLYIIGGEADATYRDDIYFSALQGDGSLGSWNTASSLPRGLWFHCAEIIDGYMYVLGGLPSSSYTGALDTIYSAPINGDGSVGSWTEQTTKLPQVAYTQSSCAVGNDIYVLGGRDNGAFGQDVFWCITVSGGTVTNIETLTPYPPTSVYTTAGTVWYHSICADIATGRIYVPDGRTGLNNEDRLYQPNPRFWDPPTPAASPTPTPPGFTAVESADWMLYE